MNEILHTPAICKKLLSIRRICKDNAVNIEFDDNFVFVKDRRTNAILLTRGIRDGLYHLDLKQLPSTNMEVSASIWRSRLANI